MTERNSKELREQIVSVIVENASKHPMMRIASLREEKGKGEEASIEFQKYFLTIANEIEGFRMQGESLLGVSDSYALAGMKWE